MKNIISHVIGFLFLFIFSTACFADDKPYYVPKVETHLMKSKYVDQTFEIRVWQPVSKKDGSEKFPVLYVVDSNMGMMLGDLMHLLQAGGDAPRFIIVGIGYPVAHAFGGTELRFRDFTPTTIDSDISKFIRPIEGVASMESGKRTGGAPEFLEFIREEVMPFIDRKYNTIPEDKAYFGDSLGGLFGLYTLFHKPDTFNRYIFGSPSIWYDDEITLKYAEEFMASEKNISANVYMSVGEKEEDPQYKMVTNVYRMQAILKSKLLPDLKVKIYVVPNETHLTVPAINIIRGVQEVFDKPTCLYLAPDCGNLPQGQNKKKD